jgi:GrpB-like predicted nucleotidyltransferase (UPF0157 family)
MKKYVFKEYSDSYPVLFEQEKRRLCALLNERVVIEHVGSTAVPFLGGKGILDIAIGVGVEQFMDTIVPLETLGYTFRPHNSTQERLFFKRHEEVQTYHIHVMKLGSPTWKELLSFRDYLRQHPEAIQEYAEIKKRAAEMVDDDGVEYRKLKEPFLKAALAKIQNS